MRRGWLFIIALAALGSLAYLPASLSLGTLPAFFRWLAIASLCWAPVAIVRAVLESLHGHHPDEDALDEIRDEITALRGDIEARFADVTLAIDDLDPRAALTDDRDDEPI